MSLAPSAVIALRYAPSASGVIASSTATRVSLGQLANASIASRASAEQTAAAATAGSMASMTPPAVCGSMRARTAPAAAGRMSTSACAATFGAMPLSERAARSVAPALGLSPPPPNSKRAGSSSAPAVETIFTIRVSSTPSSLTKVSSTHSSTVRDSFVRAFLPRPVVVMVVVVVVVVASATAVLEPIAETRASAPARENSAPDASAREKSSESGSLTWTRNGHPDKDWPLSVTATLCAPSSTQYTGDANLRFRCSNVTGLLNANPEGVCTVTVSASRPDICRMGFAGCT